MIKLIFILLGVVFVLYSIFNYLYKNVREGAANSSGSSEMDMEKCQFCDDYVEKQPLFVNDTCEICERKRVTTRK